MDKLEQLKELHSTILEMKKAYDIEKAKLFEPIQAKVNIYHALNAEVMSEMTGIPNDQFYMLPNSCEKSPSGHCYGDARKYKMFVGKYELKDSHRCCVFCGKIN